MNLAKFLIVSDFAAQRVGSAMAPVMTVPGAQTSIAPNSIMIWAIASPPACVVMAHAAQAKTA